MTRKFYSMFRVSPITEWGFGVRLDVESPLDYDQANNLVDGLEESKQEWLDLYYQARGLMVIKGLQVIEQFPELLIRLSYTYGNEVEDITKTFTSGRFFP
ncbi:MAG: hypothetical protein ACI8XC_000893 [Gammaproteobacteria bacterium]|jgi:hypothetical protein